MKKDVNACEDFFTLVVQCHILTAAMKLFKMDGLDDVPDEAVVLSDIWTHNSDERRVVLDKMCQLVIDNFVSFSYNANPPIIKDQVHKYAREVMSLGLFYFEFVDAVREGDGLRVLRCYKYFLPLFKSSQRHNYSIEVLTMLYQYFCALSPRLANELIWNRFINTHGLKGRNISCDLHIEHLNRILKEAINTKGPNKTAVSFSRIGKALGTLEPLLKSFDQDNRVSTPSTRHTTLSCKADMDLILRELKKNLIFDVDDRRSRSFSKISNSLLFKTSRENLQDWMYQKLP